MIRELLYFLDVGSLNGTRVLPFSERKVASGNSDGFEPYKLHFDMILPVEQKWMEFQVQTLAITLVFQI